MSNSNSTHYKVLDRIWKYLNNPDLGMIYYKNINNNIQNNIILRGYTDSDWGGDTITRKSTSGYIYILNNNIISWNSVQQKTITLSSCEAEYIAFKDAIKENIYLFNIIKTIENDLKLKIFNLNIPIIFSDSESGIKLAENPEFHKRTKYIDIQYYFIRQ
jgi:hypothetical protein